MTFPQQPLASLGTIQTGSTPLTAEQSYWGGNTPFVTPAELDQIEPVFRTPRTLSDHGVHQSRLLQQGAVMVCCIGSLGKIGIAGRTVVTNQQINSIEFDQSKVFPKYGFYACRRLKSTLISMAPATTIPIVSKSKFAQLEIPLPPLPEQRRIAAILDQADALRAKRREALAQLDSLTQSIFIEMFGGSLASGKRTAMGELVEEFRYGTSEKSGSKGFPALRIPNVANGRLDVRELKTVSVEPAEFKRLQLKAGDLLFVRTNGNPENVGRCAVFEQSLVAGLGFDPAEFIYASYLIRARLKRESVSPVVLQQYLHVGEGRHALRAVCKTSAGQYNINTDGLGAIPIPCFPLALQQTFATRIQAVEALKAAHRAALAELDALFASLQHRAFAGQLS